MKKFEYTRKPNFKDIKNINYDDYWKMRGFKINEYLKEREEIILSIIETGTKILDVGCGNSLLPVKLRDKGCEVEVADISGVVLEGYKKFNINGQIIDLEKTNEIELEKKYDYIILSEVLEHTRNPEGIINKLKDYTKYFLITIPNSAFYRYRLHLMFGGRFFTQWVSHPSEHLRFWSHIDFLDWLQAMDLEIVITQASNGFSFFGMAPSLKDVWKNMFGHQIVYFCQINIK